MEVFEFEVGVEIGSRAFHEKSAYGGDLKKAQNVVQSLFKNLDARYLHATGIRHRLGKVIIRTNPAQDPLRDFVRTTGGGSGAGASLAAFRDYWNKHPEEVGTTHDLAVYHVYYPPSGLAYLNGIGSRLRYATVGGRGATSWANGTVTHEFGHLWGLRHTSDTGYFYESSPRNRKGATSAGGRQNPISIMVGNRGNIGRLASDEAEAVLKTRQRRRSQGTPVDPGPVKPFGKRDEVQLSGPRAVIDVVANDYDVNNDVLDVQLLDTVSHQGGKITLSVATGPGGRNEIRYQVPPGGLPGGEDFFHYTVFDTSGKTDFGAVYVRSTEIIVDLKATAYHYDFGPEKSAVAKEYTRISPATRGDISWSREVRAVDRGSSKGVNAINRDMVFASEATTLRHRIANGTWQVILNMGDSQSDHDKMGVRAEGKLISHEINSVAGQFVYIGPDGGSSKPTSFDVKVNDGWLNLGFFDRGGGDANWVLTRLTLKRIGD